MTEAELFEYSSGHRDIEVFIGGFECDAPVAGNGAGRVGVSLTTDSPRSQHSVPVLRLDGGRRLDFAADEQTPAGHAALLVANWLNNHDVDAEARYFAELFLWQWPGIRQDGDGKWRLAGEKERCERFAGTMVDMEGRVIVEDAARSGPLVDDVRTSLNLQVSHLGYCRKKSACSLLDACLVCPHFISNISYLPAIEARIPELEAKLAEATAGNNQRLADTCRRTLRNIRAIRRTLAGAGETTEVECAGK